jgi:hypothetical protein
VILDGLSPLGSALVDSVREVHITAPRERLANGALEELKALLGRHGGRAITYLHLTIDDAREAIFLLGDNYRVTPSEEFVTAIEQSIATASVTLL